MSEHPKIFFHGHRAQNQRSLRVGELIRHTLVDIFARGELRDPDLVGVSLTISEVRVSPDLKNATVFVMPLGGNEVTKVVLALKRAKPFLRRRVAETTSMRYTPTLNFAEDVAFDQGTHIGQLLQSPEIARDLKTDIETGTSDTKSKKRK